MIPETVIVSPAKKLFGWDVVYVIEVPSVDAAVIVCVVNALSRFGDIIQPFKVLRQTIDVINRGASMLRDTHGIGKRFQ